MNAAAMFVAAFVAFRDGSRNYPKTPLPSGERLGEGRV